MFTEIKCHMCGSGSYTIVYDTIKNRTPSNQTGQYKITDHSIDKPFRIVSCRNCGLSFLNPRQTQQAILSNYVDMVDEEYLSEQKGRRASARKILRFIENLKRRSGRLLEIGCASGFLLDEARIKGWDIHGVEMSKWAVHYAKEALGLKNIIQGTLQDAHFESNHFDVVIMSDVIEHLIEPKSFLEELRPLLKPDGIFYCNTPDIDSWMSRFLGAKWWGINQAHLYYFNKSILNQLLTATGFKIIKTRSHARTFSLGYWVSSFAKYKPSFLFLDNFLKNHPKISCLPLSINLGDQIEIYARKSRQIQYLDELEAGLEKKSVIQKKKIIAVLPAYNAAKTLEKTLKDIPMDYVDEVILVDDASTDNTIEVARNLGIKVFVHKKNQGYGANQKTCYSKALEMGAEIVIMVHPDYQYDPRAIAEMIKPLLTEKADAVFASRMMKGGALEGGMPRWKYNANIFLTALENIVLGIYLTEYHTGFRAYSRKYLTSVDFMKNSNGFVFDTEIIVQGIIKFMRFEEVPIHTRYFDEASSIRLWASIVYGLNILKTLIKFVFHKNIKKIKQFE